MTPHYDKLAMELTQLDPRDALCVIEGVGKANLGDLRRSLENLAEWATWLARYVDERDGFGCGDQGYEKAVRNANRAARTLWCKAFGYSAFVDRNPEAPKLRAGKEGGK